MDRRSATLAAALKQGRQPRPATAHGAHACDCSSNSSVHKFSRNGVNASTLDLHRSRFSSASSLHVADEFVSWLVQEPTQSKQRMAPSRTPTRAPSRRRSSRRPPSRRPPRRTPSPRLLIASTLTPLDVLIRAEPGRFRLLTRSSLTTRGHLESKRTSAAPWLGAAPFAISVSGDRLWISYSRC